MKGEIEKQRGCQLLWGMFPTRLSLVRMQSILRYKVRLWRDKVLSKKRGQERISSLCLSQMYHVVYKCFLYLNDASRKTLSFSHRSRNAFNFWTSAALGGG